MTSWTNLSFSPGQLVSPSTINNILDNIIVLSTHNHSGSAGDGSETLSSNARSSNVTGVGITQQGNITLPHFMPASNSGTWGVRAVTSNIGNASNRTIWESTLLVTTDNTASGASIAFSVPVSGSSACQSNSFVVRLNSAVGPDAGCILMSFDGTSVSSVTSGSPADTSFYYSVSSYNNVTANNDYSVAGWQWKAPDGLYTMRLKITGKAAAATGYGASIMGIAVDSYF